MLVSPFIGPALATPPTRPKNRAAKKYVLLTFSMSGLFFHVSNATKYWYSTVDSDDTMAFNSAL